MNTLMEHQFNSNYSAIQTLLLKLAKIPHYSTKNMQAENYIQWLKIPITRKSDLQSDFTKFLVDPNLIHSDGIYISKTSGSTGTPVVVARTMDFERMLTKQLWKERMAWSPDIMRWKLLYLYRNIESKNMNILRLGQHEDYLDLSYSGLSQYVEDIQKFEPQWLIGPPIAVTRLAQFYKDQNRKPPPIKLVELFGEMVQPHQRSIIESSLSCRVINHYGAREFGVLSYECPRSEMHAWDKHYFFEVLKDGEPVPEGEVGELVVTSLTNKVMPLIRYSLGDLVRMTYSEKCKCGKENVFNIRPVGGRIQSLVYTNSKTITSSIFDIHFSRYIRNNPDTILEYQVIQHDKNCIVINVVVGTNFNNQCVSSLTQQLKEDVDIEHVQFKIVSSIPTLSSGKTSTFISKISI